LSWRNWLLHLTATALVLALAKAGNSNPARMAMIAITTNSSINVKPRLAKRPRKKSQSFMTTKGKHPIYRLHKTSARPNAAKKQGLAKGLYSAPAEPSGDGAFTGESVLSARFSVDWIS